MTDEAIIPPAPAPPPPPAPEPQHAGALLRAARLQQGLHIGALSAAIKVPQAKLEALEAGRYDDLLDATFTRALANTICRVLKIDAAPVLALLPGAGQSGLASVDTGLNTPYRERSGGGGDAADWVPWKRPVAWLVGLLLLAAAAFVLVPTPPRPSEPLSQDAAPAAILPPADAASAALAAPAAELASEPVASAAPPASAPASQASAPAAAAAADNTLQLRAVQASWVQVSDGDGQVLMARLVPAGETVSLSAKLPLRLRIGNAQGTELYFRGQRVDLATSTQSNIANLSLP